MSQSTFSSSEVRSGFLVFMSICVLLVLLFLSGSFQFSKDERTVQLLFNYITGLQKNAPVHVAGFKVGKVTDIRFLKDDEASVLVTCTLSNDVRLKEDAQAYLNVAGFMGEMFVELFPGSKNSPVLEDGKRIRGNDPIPLMELVKKGNDLINEFEKISGSLKGLVGNLEGIVGSRREDIDNMISNLDETSGNLKEMTYDLKRHPWKLLRKGKEEPEESKSEGKKKKTLLFF